MDKTSADEYNGPHEDEIVDEVSSQPVETGASGDPDVDAARELVIANFADEAAARAAYDEIREAERQGIIFMIDSALVDRDSGNKLHIKEEHDTHAGGGALLGAGIGTILGFIGGPLGLLIGGAAGAAVGAAVAHSVDSGMLDARLAEFADTLKPGSSMVIVAVAHYWSALAVAFLTRAGGEVSTILLTDDIARHLDAGQSGV